MPALVDTLASYVPALITRRLAADPTPLTGPIAEQLPAAIMFADITGFTPLAERLAQRGPAGAEELGRLLNAYFGQLIDLVTAHGGDVVKFAGDGLMALWATTDDEPLSHATRRAAQCALAAQAALHNYQLASDVRFTMRIGIGAGDVFAVHLGGVFQRWVFLLSGAPLAQVSAAEQQARPGQVILSPEATQLIRDDCALNVLPDGSAQLEAVRAMLAPRALASIPLSAEMESALRAYIPIALLARVTAGQSQWLAELRRVTVLFINLPDLDYRTPLAQAQTILRELQNALYHYEGSIDDLGVDDKGVSLIVALGLPPLAHEDDAARGIAAARAMQAKLRALGVRSAIGVTTGRVFCGTVGNATRSSYNMVGDGVNLASRLMQAARDDILCDANTYLAARDHVTFDALPPIAVKGKAERVAVYRPVSDSATKLQSGERPQTAIVGRAPERAALEAQLQALLQRESGVVVIEGEAGIGKSQLVEATRRQARAMGITTLVGAGDAVEKAAAYHGWRGVFHALLGLTAGAAAATQRAQAERGLGPDLAARAPLLNAMLPLEFPENDVTQPLTGTARAEQTRDLLVTLLQGVAAAAPLALFIEDAHWLDSASWALLLAVAQHVAPALLVVATRPLTEPLPTEYIRLLESPNTTHLPLPPLSANDTQTLICQRLGVRRLPEAIAALIRNKAEGHPFFSEELAYAMRDTGLIEIADGECRVMPHVDLQAVALPDTVQGVIISRIDRLLPQQQLTLKVASAIGTNFGVQMLRDIHPIDDDKPRLENYLRALERVDLTLLDAPEPNLTYAFKHIITRDVAYNLMLFAQRRQLHRAVAEWYERTAADDLSPYYPLLAYHWTMAGVTVKALDYLEKASLQAYSNGLTKEATTLGLEAARLLGVSLPTDPREIVPAIGAEMGEIQQRMAGRAPSELIDLPPLDEPDIGSVVGTLLRTMPFAYTSRQPELFALMAVKNLSLTLKHGHGLFSPLAYSMYAIVYRAMTGDSRTAHAFSQLALDLNARQGHALTASVEFVHTWFINHWVNPIASNLDMNLDGARAGFASGDLLYACFNSAAYVVYLSAMGAPLDDVIAMGAQQLAVINNRVANAAYHCLHEMQFAKALAGRTRDRFSFSDAQYDEARDVASIVRTDLYNQIGYYYVSKLRLHYYYGDYAAALEYAAQAQPLLPAFEGQVAEPEYRLFGALALLARSREVEASARDELLALAAAHLEKLRAWSAVYAGNFTHKLKLVEAEWARNAGRDTEAQASYREAAQSAEQFGFTHHAALANELAAQHALALGDTTVARAHLAAARDGYARWGAWAKVKDVEERYRLPIPPQ